MNDAGQPMIDNIPNEFSKNFDWILTRTHLFKRKEIPETIYTKTDFLPTFVRFVLPLLNTKFKLISGCGDFSPSVNFPREYIIIVNNPLLVRWYSNNKIHENDKVTAIPAGMCSLGEKYHNLLLTLNKESLKVTKRDKILCCWRERDFNHSGPQFITRAHVKKFILEYPDIFDWVEPNLIEEDFYKLLMTYKYVLCPVGNGVDPSPKSFEAIALNTVPIMIRSANTREVYANLPCILVDDFKEIIDRTNLEMKFEAIKDLLYKDDTLYKLSAERWAAKIIND